MPSTPLTLALSHTRLPFPIPLHSGPPFTSHSTSHLHHHHTHIPLPFCCPGAQAAQELLATHPRAWFFVASNSQPAVAQFCAAVQGRCLTFLGAVRASGGAAPLSPGLACALRPDFSLTTGRATVYVTICL